MTALHIRVTRPETDYETIAKIFSMVQKEEVTIERLKNWDERVLEDDIFEQYSAILDDKLVGYGSVFRPATAKILKMAIEVLVDEAMQGQGIGSQIYEFILARAKAHHSTRLTVFCREDAPHAVEFAKKRGFTIRHETFKSVLDVQNFNTAPYAELIAAAENSGIRFSSLVAEGNNDDTLRKLYELNVTVADDEPTHDGSSEHNYQTWKSYIAGADWFYPSGQLIALDGEKFVGLGAVGFHPDGRAFNAFTGILPEYRGRKLAQALKIKGIEFVRACGGTSIYTGNDSTNAAMLAINERLGYVRQPGEYMMWLEL